LTKARGAAHGWERMAKNTDAAAILAATRSIVARAEAEARRSGVRPSTVSKRIFAGDARVVSKLKDGWRGIKLASLIAGDARLRRLERGR